MNWEVKKVINNVHILTDLQLNSALHLQRLTVSVYLPGGSALRVDDVIEVFMNSVQQPEEEFLGIVLGVTPELKGTLGHHILQQIIQKKDN